MNYFVQCSWGHRIHAPYAGRPILFHVLRIGRRGRHDIGQSSIAFNQLDISKIHLRRFHRQFNISSHNNDIVITGKIGLDGNNCRQLCRYKNLKGNGFFQAFTRGDGDFHLSLLLYSLIHRQCNLFEPLGFSGREARASPLVIFHCN